MSTPPPNSKPAQPFQLLWTIGFSGKRFLDPQRGQAIATALREVIQDLMTKAAARHARLTAISSLSRGGDVLFAETVRSLATPDAPFPFKGLLPFAWEDFIRLDLEKDQLGNPLAEAERAEWRRRAEACRAASRPSPEVTSPSADPTEKASRDEAYLECGYRTVDESDVMIFLLREDEFRKLPPPPTESNPACTLGVGTFAVACYALATGRPVILLNAGADDIAASRCLLNPPPVNHSGEHQWFFDPLVTGIVQKAVHPAPDAGAVLRETASNMSAPLTSARESVAAMGAQLGALANRHQGRTQNGLRWILRFHLAASALAAVAATIFVVERPETTLKVFLCILAFLAFLKPALAFAALRLEHRLHHDGTRDAWLYARVLAELCRGAVATWPLRIQPLDAQDEEDFPKIKRMIRTLRLLREQDGGAAAQATDRREHETQVEADMRAACANYIKERLQDQASYYGRKHERALAEEHNWRRGFQISTWTAILAGLVLAVDRTFLAAGSHVLSGPLERTLEALIIIAPFLAAHCLGTMTILDSRRRCRRYPELRDYLTRLAAVLERTEANPSRIRLVEHAERTLIEEQHEWFSVMRNTSI